MCMKQLKIGKTITTRESDGIQKYLADITKEDLITPEEEGELARRIRAGDERALEKLVRANLRFVVSVAKQYQNPQFQLNDLINEGNLGLVKAAKKFDETRGFKFISYAVWWIRQSILQAIAEHRRLIRLPLNKVAIDRQVYMAELRFISEHERIPTHEELAEMLGVKVEEVALVQSSSYLGHFSLDAGSEPFTEGDRQLSISYGTIADDKIPSPDAGMIGYDSLSSDVRDVLGTLSEKERYALIYFFGIGGAPQMSLDEVGERLGGVSRERARQLRDKALARIRGKKDAQEKLKKYLG